MTGASFLEAAVPGLLAYLIGGLPFGYLFVRLTMGKDVRTLGSGNIGATNVHRSAGRKAGIVVLLLDVAKAFVAVWLASAATRGYQPAIAAAIVGSMLGHCYPVYLRFKGGKAVACYIGAFLFAAPLTVLAGAVVFIAAVAVSRFISVGSIAGAIAFPILLAVISHPSDAVLVASVLGSILIIWRHRGNIQRLRTGTEHMFSLKGGTH